MIREEINEIKKQFNKDTNVITKYEIGRALAVFAPSSGVFCLNWPMRLDLNEKASRQRLGALLTFYP